MEWHLRTEHGRNAIKQGIHLSLPREGRPSMQGREYSQFLPNNAVLALTSPPCTTQYILGGIPLRMRTSPTISHIPTALIVYTLVQSIDSFPFIHSVVSVRVGGKENIYVMLLMKRRNSFLWGPSEQRRRGVALPILVHVQLFMRPSIMLLVIAAGSSRL